MTNYIMYLDENYTVNASVTVRDDLRYLGTCEIENTQDLIAMIEMMQLTVTAVLEQLNHVANEIDRPGKAMN